VAFDDPPQILVNSIVTDQKPANSFIQLYMLIRKWVTAGSFHNAYQVEAPERRVGRKGSQDFFSAFASIYEQQLGKPDGGSLARQIVIEVGVNSPEGLVSIGCEHQDQYLQIPVIQAEVLRKSRQGTACLGGVTGLYAGDCLCDPLIQDVEIGGARMQMFLFEERF
jgi:hypothetical protein